jgi:hypothetical protein
MSSTQPVKALARKDARRPSVRKARPALHSSSVGVAHAAVLEEARRTGLFGGDKTEHVSFRAPPALVEAAKRETGLNSTTELGLLALALLAQADPVAAFMKQSRRILGDDHSLEY